MHPILFKLGPLTISSFGATVALGFLAGLYFTRRLASRHGVPPDLVWDLFAWILIGAVLGARLLYVVVHPDEFSNLLTILAIWKGGLVFYGGFAGAFVGGLIFLRFRRPETRFLDVADVCMPGGFLGLAIGRWGCFLVGDDYGRITDVPWAVRFPQAEGLLLPEPLIGKPLHPTQIYMSINALLICLVLWWVLSHRSFRGQVLWTALILYPVGRFVIEFYRGDDAERGFIGPLSTSQWIGIPIFVLGAAMLVRGWRRRATE